MIEYPKIENSKYFPMKPCIAFVKYDGSNLRFEWQRKRGWNKFGTRSQLFDHTHPIFGCAIEIFKNTYAEQLEKVFTDNKDYRKRDMYTVFCEFFGPNSFAGLHKAEDQKELMLFDIRQHKYGFIGPRQFIKDFKNIKIAKVVYDGKFNGTFADNVRNGKYADKGVVEGVVCKSGSGGHEIFMCKVKTYAYLEKLKQVYASNWKDFWE